MKFNSNHVVKEFVKVLIENLEEVNENVLKEELIDWGDCCFTTSSEFLGELKLILEKVEKLETLDAKVRSNVISCIADINKAFGMS